MVLNDDGNIDMALATTLHDELRKVQINPQEARWVEMDGKKIALIKSLGRGRTVILYHDAYSTSGQNLGYVAGTIIQEDASATTTGDLCFRASFRECTEKDFEKKAHAAMASQSMQLGSKQKEYRLICSCCSPLISHTHQAELGRELFGPCACQDLAHPQCLPQSLRDNLTQGAQYQCTPCLARELFPGVIWSAPQVSGGEEMINTCPIDNFFTALAIFLEEQNADLEDFFPLDDEHQDLRATLELLRRRQFNLAHTKYYRECMKMNEEFLARPETKELEQDIKDNNKRHKDALKRNTAIKARNAKILEHNKKHPNDPKDLEKEEDIPEKKVLTLPIPELSPKNSLWGEVFQRVHDKHVAGFEVSITTSCSNPACGRHPETTNEVRHIVLGDYLNYPNDLRGVEDLQKMTMAFEQPCRGCNAQGIITQKDYFTYAEHWALSFDATTLNYDKREQLKIDILNGKLPDTITLKDPRGEPAVYGLASVTLEQKGHFVSTPYLPSRGEFVFYDGMATPSIRKLHPSDFTNDIRKVYSIDYFRLK
jgi:hypothetical protein